MFPTFHRVISLLLVYVLVMQTLAPPAFAAPKPGFAFAWPNSHIFKKPNMDQPAAATTVAVVQPAPQNFSVVLTPLSTAFNGHAGIEHHQPLRKLVVSANSPSGMPNNFESLDADGTHRPYSNVAGLTGGLKITTARDDGTGMSLGGFAPGELFSGTGVPGVIARIAADGATVQNPWVTLPEEIGADGGLFIDRTGVFGGDLIAVTATGGVWRITSAGVATRIANLDTPLEGVTTVPNDVANYGPWAGKILAGAKTQNAIFAIDVQGVSTSYPISISPQDIRIIPAHENFYGVDPTGNKIWGAPDDAFAGMIGDILIAQGSPGVLMRVVWNGTEFEAGPIAQVSSLKQIVFSPAALSQIEGVKQFYDKIAVVRHAPQLNSGRVEGALWQLLPENLALDGTDVITSDLLVPGTPTVTLGSGNPTFDGVIPGVESTQPTGYSITISNNAHLRHVITRTNPISLMPILAPPAPNGTRDVSLTTADGSIGDPATLRHLSISGKAGAVVVPPGTYGRFAASGHTTLVLGVEGTTVPSVYNLEELLLDGGSELRVVGPIKLTVKTNVTLVGSSLGAPDDPTRLLLQVAQGTVSVSGNAVLYGIVRNPQGMVSIPGNGRIRGTVTCDRLLIDGNGVLQITYSDVAPPPVNRPPAVDAGPDQTITLPTDTVSLNGVATDDGLPVTSTLVTTWTKVSGPGPVTFANAGNPITTATFTEPGEYVLRLTANDSLLTVVDEMAVEVIPRNQPPEVNAGPDQTIELPHTAKMAGVVTDDALPRGSSVTRTWSVVNGPGAVTFADVHDLTTTVTFAAPGDYTLRLTADDTEFTVSDDVVITVHPENQPPVVNAGPDQTLRLPAGATLNGTATDDGWPFGSTLTTSWTKVSGPGTVTFANAASPVTTAQFSVEGTYVLRLTADDTRFTVSDECTITVLPANIPPVVNAGPDQQLTFLQSATLNGTATDDGLPVGSVVEVAWTKVSGPGTVTFSSPETPVSNATFSQPGTYVLRLTGDDTQFSAQDETTITVNPRPHAFKVYTLNNDFNLGSLINLSLNPADQLQLDETSRSFKFMWVAVSTKGTTVKINTETGQIIGEYFTAPNGQPRDPSRTTVDHNGNVWNTNRAGNSVVHIGLVENGQCVDRNGNGVIDTSTGFNDIRPWTNAGNANTNGGVSTAQDECILHYTRVNSFGTRHVAVTTDNDIWVSGTSGQRFDLIDGVTGQIKRQELSVGFGGYGGLIDRNGVIWSANPMLRWDTSKPLNGPNGVNWRGYSHPSYGLCIDSQGNVYNTSFGNGTIRKFDPNGTLLASFNQGSPWAQGCVVDRNDHVWIAHSLNTNTVGHMKADGVYIGTITVGSGPTGVAVDGDGKIWSTNYNSGTVSRINPALGPIGGDGVTRVGAVEFTTPFLGGNPYNYSDMTGSTLTGAPDTGTWSAVFDSQIASAEWGRIGWTAQVCGDGLITVSVATSENNVTYGTPVVVSNGDDPPVPNGRFIKITVKFDRASSGESPILYDLSIGTVGFPLETPANVAPGIDAGPDQTITGKLQTSLRASVCDDALPSNKQLTTSWSKVSGPGTVSFSKPNSTISDVTFGSPGTYTLRMTASDSVHTGSDTLIVTVIPGNQAPVVNAGPDQTISFVSGAGTAFISDPARFNAVAGSPAVAVDFDNIATGTNITGQTISGVTFQQGTAPSAPLIVVRGQDTVTPAGFSSAPNPSSNKLLPTSGENVLSPGGTQLAPGPNPTVENDDIRMTFATPVSAVGFDILFQSLDCCSFTSVRLLDANGQTIHTTSSVPTGSAPGGVPGGSVFFGFVSTSRNIATVIIDDTDDTADFPDSNIGIDTIRLGNVIPDAAIAPLAGSVTDDGLPAGSTLTSLWSKLSGPGLVTFGNASQPVTTASFTVAGTYVLRLEASDTEKGSFDDVTIVVQPRPNRAPDIVSEPTTELSLGAVPGGSGDLVNLGPWTTKQYELNSQPDASWVKDLPNNSVTQTVNADAAILLSDFNFTNGQMDGTWRVNTTTDDDYIGFVFGYQNSEHFYLFDWKKADQSDPLGFSERGMTLKVVNASSTLTGADFWPTAGNGTRVRQLFHNTVPWASFTDYQFTLQFRNGEIKITLKQGATVLADFTVNDSTYTNGLFGFYNYSQEQVKYSGFRKLSLAQATYTYDVDAVDPDNDAISYSLTTAPLGMTINSTTGLITYPVTSRDAGDHAVAIRAQDVHGAFDTQSYTLTILNQNQAPIVSAGADQAVAVNGTATLNGTVTDDGLPRNATVTSTWSMVSGPGLVSFANSSSPATTATFSEAGTYVLRLTATDTALTASDEVVVTVTPPNHAPEVNAGADIAITLPGIARLNGTVADDGLPLASTVTVTWSQVSGPGTTTFANAAAAVTTATFSEAGTYVLQLAASDTELTGTDTVTVTVNAPAPNQAPLVEAGANQSTELNANRVQNPGNDEPLVNGEIRGWIEAVGTSWTRAASGASGFPESVNGGHIFYAGETASAELRQDVNVSAFAATIAAGTQAFAWKAFVRSRAETLSDTARVIIEYRNATNTTMIARLDSGDVVSTNAWQLVEDTRIVPAGTGWIRIRLIATRRTGTTNDAYFDALSLRPVTGAGVKLAGLVTDDGLPASGVLTPTWSKVSGPGAVTFANVNAASTSATFTDAGVYVLRLTASDSELSSSSDDVTITVEAANLAPIVNAGADQTVTLPSTASLSGSVSDDGKPVGATVTSKWAKVSGPGTVTFADATALNTTATFSVEGTYVLSLTADDGEYTTTDTITIIVNPVPPNAAPTVNAGADQIINPPATSATLIGTVNDDGLPPGSSLTYLWSKVSGPGNVTFSTPTALTTNATFSEAGAYILRLTANDSALSGSDDVRVTLNGTNKAPTVNAGADQTVAHPTTVNLIGTATDDGLPVDSTLTFSWTKVSGPGTVTFATASALQTTAAFSTSGTYVLRLTASDTALSASDDVTITQTPPPTANINSPASGSTITGRTTFIGTVSEGTTWRLEYSLNEDGVAPTWITLASGNTPVTNGALGAFDPTVLLNGLYTVRLVASNGGGQTTATSVTAIVEGEQKIGNFSLVFNDLEVPLAGMPIDVLRTYDSRDKRKGDFGVGWTVGIRNVRVQESGLVGNGWQGTVTSGFLPNYCIQPTGSHLVTVTLPSNEIFKFEASLTPQCSRVFPPRETTIGFTPLPGTNATLTPVGDPTVFVNLSFPGDGELLDYSTLEPKDFQQYRLTLPNGDVLLVDQRDGLKQKTDANGNTITINTNGISHSSGKSVSFVRDANGRIERIVDPLGATMTYSYDANGDLVSYRDRENNLTTYTYNSSHGLLTIVDPRGIQPVRNEYDDTGRLVRQIDAFGKIVNFARDLTLRQEVVTDRLGHATVYEYNARGNVVRITNPEGGIITRTYDSRDNMLSETDVNGKVSTFTYDAVGNRLTETDPLGNVTRYTYNSRRQVLTITDPSGKVTTKNYDANGNLISATDPAGNTAISTYNTKGQETSFKDGLGNITQFTYDTAGNLTTQTDQVGNVATFTYDANGNRLSESMQRTVNGVTETLLTSYVYDHMGRMTKVTHPDGTFELTTYNALGQQLTAVDALNRVTRYEYDNMGRLSKTIFPDNLTEEITYDNEGRRIKIVDRAQRITTNTYDSLGRLLKTVYPDGKFASSTYFANGMTATTTDEKGHVTRYEYDASRRLTKVIDALNNTLVFTNDANGNRTSMTDSKGQITRYEYDANQRRNRIVFPDTTSVSMTYDAVGRMLAKTDQAGKTTQYEYDKRGKLLKVTDARGGITSFTYDELGHQLTQTDANNRTTSYAYDKNGRRIRRTLPLGMSETYGYDAASQLTSRKDFNGKTTLYGYDSMGRLTSRTPDASTGQASVTFTYTAMGKRETMVDASGATSYSYDERDRMTLKATPHGSLTYTYDETGKLLTMRSSNANGVSVDYTYDALNRLETVVDRRLTDGTTTYSYDVNGNLESTLYPNSVRSTYSYDSLNRLTNVAVTNGSPIAGYAYTLGPAGNRLSVTEAGGRVVTYTYDALYRLTSETISGAASNNGSVGYTYDAVGNRLNRTSTVSAVTPTTSTFDANDRLESDTFDNNGNTLQSNGITYQFDFENRLTSANNGNVTFVYDGDGNRVAKTTGGITTHYLIDTQNPTGHAQAVEEIVGGQVQRQYTYGHNLISQRQLLGGNRTTSFYGLDGSGSVRFLTNNAGTITDTYTYDAFGKLIASTGATPNDHLFVGEHFDNQVGFYYLRARYMNPDTGRFWTMDDFEGMSSDPMSLHKYLYANANPTNIVDPTGHYSIAMQAPTMGMMMSLAAMALLNFMKVLFAVAAVAVIATTAAILIDRMIQMITVAMSMAAAIAAAKVLLVQEFEKFRKSSEFQRPGNHWAEFEYPTPPVGSSPRVVLRTSNIGPVKFTEYEGGGPGRVFQFKYGIGANATLGRGLFLFRLDYMNYDVFPPRPDFHYHLRYGNVNIDHEPLDF